MAFKKRWLFAILAWILVLSLLQACAAEKVTPMPTEPPVATPTPKSIPSVSAKPVDEVSLEEAEKIVGAPLTPKYLPAGWRFQRGFMKYQPPRAGLILFFSDEEMPEEVQTPQDFASLTYKIVLNVKQIKEMPSPDVHERMAEAHGGKVVDINGVKGWLSSGGHDLHWFLPGLHFFMFVAMTEDLPEEEILQIAESIK